MTETGSYSLPPSQPPCIPKAVIEQIGPKVEDLIIAPDTPSPIIDHCGVPVPEWQRDNVAYRSRSIWKSAKSKAFTAAAWTWRKFIRVGSAADDLTKSFDLLMKEEVPVGLAEVAAAGLRFSVTVLRAAYNWIDDLRHAVGLADCKFWILAALISAFLYWRSQHRIALVVLVISSFNCLKYITSDLKEKVSEKVASAMIEESKKDPPPPAEPAKPVSVPYVEPTPDIQNQNGVTTSSVVVAVALLFVSVVIGYEVKKKSWKGFMDAVSKFPSFKKGLKSYAAEMVEWIKWIIATCCDFVAGSHPKWSDPCSEPIVADFVKDARLWLDENAKDPQPTDEKKRTLYALITAGDEITLSPQWQDTSPPLAHVTTRLLEELRKHIPEYIMFDNPIFDRIEPVPLLLYSKPGQGKSNMLNFIIAMMLPRLVPNLDVKDFIKNPMKYVHVRHPGVGFWDGYHNQPIVIYDDLDYLNELPGNASQIAELIGVLNAFPYHLDMAVLEKKASSFFTSKLVIMTTNSDRPQSAAVKHEGAIDRRFGEAYEVRVRPEWLKEKFKKTSLKGESPKPDWGRIKKHIEENQQGFLDIWEFRPYIIEGGKTKSLIAAKDPGIDMSALVSRLNRRLQINEAVKKSISKAAAGVFSATKQELINQELSKTQKAESAGDIIIEMEELESEFTPVKLTEVTEIEDHTMRAPAIPESWDDTVEHSEPLQPVSGASDDDQLYLERDLTEAGVLSEVEVFPPISCDYPTMVRLLKWTDFKGIQAYDRSKFWYMIHPCYRSVMRFFRAMHRKRELPEGDFFAPDFTVKLPTRSDNAYDRLSRCVCLARTNLDNPGLREFLSMDHISTLDAYGLLTACLTERVGVWARIKYWAKQFAKWAALPAIAIAIYALWSWFGSSYKEIQVADTSVHPEFSIKRLYQRLKDKMTPLQIQNHTQFDFDSYQAALRSVFSISHNGKNYGVAYGVRGEYWVTAAHVVNELLVQLEKPDDVVTITQIFPREGAKSRVEKMSRRELEACYNAQTDYHNNKEKDRIVICKVYSAMGPMPDKSNILLDSAYKTGSGEFTCYGPAWHTGKPSVFEATAMILPGPDGVKFYKHSPGSIPGESGRPLFATVNGRHCIVGVLKGTDRETASSAYYVPITRGWFEDAVTSIKAIRLSAGVPPVSDNSIQDCSVGAPHVVMGVKQTSFSQPIHSTIRRSPIFEGLVEQDIPLEKIPVSLDWYVDEGELKHPIFNLLETWPTGNEYVDLHEVKAAARTVLDRLDKSLRTHSEPAIRSTNFKRALTFEEAVEGTKDGILRSIARNTSPGYPFIVDSDIMQQGGRKYFLGKEGPVDFSSPRVKLLRTMVYGVIDRLKAGMRNDAIIATFLKDELRSVEKHHKPRSIDCANFVFFIAGRILFGGFAMAMACANIDVGCAIGVNPYTQWSEVEMRLKSNPKVFAGDTAGWDQELNSNFPMGCGLTIVDWYADPELASARTTYVANFCFPVRFVMCPAPPKGPYAHLYEKLPQWKRQKGYVYVVVVFSGMSPGDFLTAVLNTLCNITLHVVCFARITDLPYEAYWVFCFIIALGDDHVVTSSDDRYNALSYSSFKTKIGMRYTTATKQPVVIPYDDWKNVQFLGRFFHHLPGFGTTAPLQYESIYRMVYWTKKGVPDSLFSEQAKLAACEMALHGKQDYDKFVQSLIRAFRHRPMLVPKFPPHPEAVAILKNIGESYIAMLPGSNSFLAL